MSKFVFILFWWITPEMWLLELFPPENGVPVEVIPVPDLPTLPM